MDVHHRLSVGYHRPVPSPVAGRHDLDSRSYGTLAVQVLWKYSSLQTASKHATWKSDVQTERKHLNEEQEIHHGAECLSALSKRAESKFIFECKGFAMNTDE